MFSKRSRNVEILDERLRAIAGRAHEAGIFCDFDGSLAPIVPDPEHARAVPGASRALQALARRFALVTVISGRPVSFLAKHLHARGVRMVGLYGIEERVGRTMQVLPEVRAAHAAVDRAAALLRERLAHLDGVYIEDKGLAVSVHFRRADDPQHAMLAAHDVVTAIADECGLGDPGPGKLIYELGPKVSVDKGAVVSRLVEQVGLQAAVAIGDDRGDIPMFRALDALELPVRVVVRSPEVPPELLALAEVQVDAPADVVRLLRALASA